MDIPNGTPAVAAAPIVPATTPAGGGSVPPAGGSPAIGGGLPPAATPPATAIDAAAIQRQYEALQAENQQFRQQFVEEKRLADWARQQLGQQRQQAPAQPPVNPLGVLPWDSRNDVYLARDASGNVVEKPGAPYGLAAQFVAHEASAAAALRKLAMNPHEALAPIIEKMVAERAGQAAQQQIARTQEEQLGVSFEQSNADWLYEKDASGRFAADINGGPRYSPHGQAFAALIADANRMGIPSVQGKLQYAMNGLKAMVAGQQFAAQPAQPPAPNPQQQALMQRWNWLQSQAQTPNPALPQSQPAPAAQAPAAYGQPAAASRIPTFSEFYKAKMRNGTLATV